MITNEMVLRAARTLLVTINKLSDEALPVKIASSCKQCAMVSAVAAFFIGWLPVAGAGLAALVSAIAVWTMYVKINAAISLPFSSNLLKSILIAVGTNLLAYWLTVVVATVISFVPFLGSIVSMIVMSVATYAVTLSSAYVYLNILAKMFGKEHELKPVDMAAVRRVVRPAVEDSAVQNLSRAFLTEFNSKGESNNERQ